MNKANSELRVTLELLNDLLAAAAATKCVCGTSPITDERTIGLTIVDARVDRDNGVLVLAIDAPKLPHVGDVSPLHQLTPVLHQVQTIGGTAAVWHGITVRESADT